MRTPPYLLLLIILCFTVHNTDAQRKKKAAGVVGYDESLYSAVNWRLVGPFRGGRAGTVSGVVGNPNLYYMGTAGGGVWKSEDAGSSWECISDGFFGGSIGAIAVSESDPNVIYVGEGEQTLRGNVSSGNGLWKSMDAGKTWEFIGLKGSEHIARIRIHPTNPDIVYVAAIGNLWIPNETREYTGVPMGENNGKKSYTSVKKPGPGILLWTRTILEYSTLLPGK